MLLTSHVPVAVPGEGPEDSPDSIRGYVVPFILEAGKPGRGGAAGDDGGMSPPNRAASEERVLVVGQVRNCVGERGGGVRLLAVSVKFCQRALTTLKK